MPRTPMTMLALTAVILLGCARVGAQDLLLHYPFDEGSGDVARDASGNGLDGRVAAPWVGSPSGHALMFDGKPQSVVQIAIPEPLRFGTGSWTFSAWIRPIQFEYDDRQNQRRLFAYGTFPDAYLVIDITGVGQLNWYFCYRNEAGGVTSTGGSSALKFSLDAWAHLALVVDREKGEMLPYINGFNQGTARLPQGFVGDYSLNGQLTLGSGWHNYWGLMDEVKIYRRAVPRSEIRDEFKRHKEVFGVEELPEAAAAERREALLAAFDQVNVSWAAGDWAAVRAACQALAESPDAPANVRSYAHLRIAQSHQAAGDAAAARTEYLRIAAQPDYPEVHRVEAVAVAKELERTGQGLPAVDPAATRTTLPSVGEFAGEVVMSPAGDDNAPGTAAAPVRTLTAARDRVRALRQAGTNGPILVRIQPGVYPVTETLALTAEDSGSEGAPVVWRSEQPGGAVFYGGAQLGGFTPVTDPAILNRLPEEARGQVVRCDLRAQGITDYGQLAVRGFGQAPSPPTLEVFVDREPMTLARWPNEGFVGIKELIEPGDRTNGTASVFSYEVDRPERWTNAEDPWLFGYFRFLWADATIQLSKIDSAAKTMTFDTAYHYGRPGMHTGQGIQWYAFNLLEEIDQPGEWYLDRQHGVLYLYPPRDLAAATVEVGLLDQPMVTLDRVNDVRFEGLTLDLARFNGVVARDCRRLLFAGCTVSRMAGNGISILGGEENGLFGCDLHTMGRRASEVTGGDRETLTPGRHFVENCRIHNFGRIDRTYTPAIQLEGVGHRVAHNLMYDCPSSVMRIEGNDHLIEYNEVHSAVQESDDQGAMELFRNATYRGVIFRYNRFTNVGKTKVGVAVHGQAGIRFDDAISGMLVYGNIFIRSSNGNFGAIQMNSGRDNIMDNNVFYDCRYAISGGWNAGNSVWRMLGEGNWPADFFRNDLYLSRYPLIATMLEPPGMNHIWRNVFLRCSLPARGNQGYLDQFGNGEFEENPGFVDPEAGDFRLTADSRLLQSVGYRPIAVEQIGLYEHPLRASWPVVTTPAEVPDWRQPTAGH